MRVGSGGDEQASAEGSGPKAHATFPDCTRNSSCFGNRKASPP